MQECGSLLLFKLVLGHFLTSTITHLLHDDILALPQELTLALHDSLKEVEVLHMQAVALYTPHKVLDDGVRDTEAQLDVVLEYGGGSHSLAYSCRRGVTVGRYQ